MPEAIRGLANDILKDPETLRVGNSAPTETVSHAIYPVAQHLKTKLLLELLNRNTEGSVLVFTRTKHRAKRLAENLEKVGHKATALQGNLSQNRRKEAMDGFRAGRFRVLVATDIAARGIDVSQISHVVNFDVPSTPETYTHRIGRTGRAERSGEAHTFVTGEDVSMVRAIERLLREPLTRKKLDGFDYNEGPSSADKDFNRPIMDGRGGRGGYGGGGGGGYGAPRPPQRAARPAYGAPRSDNSDRRDAEGNRVQPGDDIYAADRPARGYGDRDRNSRSDRPSTGRPSGARPGYGRPGQKSQGARPQGNSRPQGVNASNSTAR
jgi:ATP-dependent RNA helicase RhlE